MSNDHLVPKHTNGGNGGAVRAVAAIVVAVMAAGGGWWLVENYESVRLQIAFRPQAPAAAPAAGADTAAASASPSAPVAATGAAGVEPPSHPTPVAEVTPTSDATPPRGPPPTPAEPARPTFDIVRVGPQGSAVVAGRAAPNAEVALLDNGTEIAHAQADASGQWVALPAAPLPAGGQELTLSAKTLDGTSAQGDAPVVVVVPAPKAAAPAAAAVPAAPALAVLLPSDAKPRVLQAPAPPSARGRSSVGLDTVDYDDAGAIRFAGRGVPGSVIQLYVDDGSIGKAVIDPQGNWEDIPTAPVSVGDHRLRLDEVGINGQVLARIELPFERALLAPEQVPQGHVVVQPGQNLWRIARHAYGHGIRYTLIYDANREQIRNENRIYPGEVLLVPPLHGAAATGGPASSSASSSQSR
jgi:nucleoid-associated protein YgaU